MPPMQASVMFIDGPAYMDDSGPVRCGLPAEVGAGTMLAAARAAGPHQPRRTVPGAAAMAAPKAKPVGRVVLIMTGSVAEGGGRLRRDPNS